MKLLTKEQISVTQSLERQKEVQEGAKLAKKVDDLRELSAKEQSNLTKFRDESLKKIKQEIEVVISERDKVLKEVTDLQAETKRLREVIEKTLEDIKNLTKLK